MKERPILFSGPMVRALLDGSKKQTRRVLKQATGPSLSVGIDDAAPGVAELSWLWGDGPGHDVHETTKRVACPYGQPGDRLWVREAWAPGWTYQGEYPCVFYRADGTAIVGREDLGLRPQDRSAASPPEGLRWKPSIHMPRWASRITLEITGVRVERLQDTSVADALAEGIVRQPDGGYGLADNTHYHATDPRQSYLSLWESINGDGSAAANPWVWVVEFRGVQP